MEGQYSVEKKGANFVVYNLLMKEALSGGTDRSDSGNSYSEFSGYIAERVMEHYEDEMIAQEDIVIDRIYHGHFSSVDTDEIFVLCKISNTSHGRIR